MKDSDSILFHKGCHFCCHKFGEHCHKYDKGANPIKSFECIGFNLENRFNKVVHTKMLLNKCCLICKYEYSTTCSKSHKTIDLYDKCSKFELKEWLKKYMCIDDENINDPINSPHHYTSHESGIECIQITEHMDFLTGNIFKYLWRYEQKGNQIEDLKKAKWYLNRLISNKMKDKEDV